MSIINTKVQVALNFIFAKNMILSKHLKKIYTNKTCQIL